MNYSINDRPAEANAESTPDANGAPETIGKLCEIGARTFRNHNLRKQAATRAGERSAEAVGVCRQGDANDARVASVAHKAIINWQQANMSAAAGETLLSRVLGGYQAGFGPSATPGLIAEVIEMRARANELLYDVLIVTK